jgi:CarD family transcriptional regulator
MTFDVGDKVVYPHHGAAVVERREQLEAFGETREYLVLKLHRDRLTLMVPTDQAEEVGLRPPIGTEEVEEIFSLLRKPPRVPANWSRRYKNHLEKLKSGDIYGVAEVVRNLAVQGRSKPLSAAEREMLGTARRILVSELTLALDLTDQQVEDLLAGILA